MKGKVRINDVPFEVTSVRVGDGYFFCDLVRMMRPVDEANALFYCGEAAIYAEDYRIENDKLAGDVVLYTLEHEGFVQLDMELSDGELTGKGRATVLGDPCTVEIIEPIALLT